MLKYKKLFLVAIMASIISTLGAQTNSPYSRYGYGVLRDQVTGPSKAMGGIGYGLRNSLSSNVMNPASYSKVDSLTFIFDMGVSFNKAKLSDSNNSRSDYNGGLDYITILFPVSKRVGISAGVLPYSSVGYDFGSTTTVSNGVTTTGSYLGTGGISQVYGGIGYSTPIKGLSLGANISYIFGVIEHTKSTSFSGVSANQLSRQSEIKMSTAKFDFGVQYELPLSKEDNLVLGAVYTPGIGSKANFLEIEYLSTTIPSAGTTIANQKVDAGLPTILGAGFTYNSKNKLTIGADVTSQQWKDVKYSPLIGDGFNDSERFNNRMKYAVGAEYIIDPRSRSYIKKIRFRGGGNYSNSYLNVLDVNKNVAGYNEYGATLGFGLPLRDKEALGYRTSYVNINFEYKKINPKASSLVKEEYFGVSVNVNLNELWFLKRKIY